MGKDLVEGTSVEDIVGIRMLERLIWLHTKSRDFLAGIDYMCSVVKLMYSHFPAVDTSEYFNTFAAMLQLRERRYDEARISAWKYFMLPRHRAENRGNLQLMNYVMGRVLLKQRECPRARVFLQSAKEHAVFEEIEGDACLRLGRMLISEKRYAESYDYMVECHRVFSGKYSADPIMAKVLLYYSCGQRAKGGVQEAAESLAAAFKIVENEGYLKHYRTKAMVMLEMGNALFAQEKFDQAYNAFVAAESAYNEGRLDKETRLLPKIMLGKGNAERGLSKFEEAAKTYNATIIAATKLYGACCIENVRPLVNFATLRFQLGYPKSCLECLASALTILFQLDMTDTELNTQISEVERKVKEKLVSAVDTRNVLPQILSALFSQQLQQQEDENTAGTEVYQMLRLNPVQESLATILGSVRKKYGESLAAQWAQAVEQYGKLALEGGANYTIKKEEALFRKSMAQIEESSFALELLGFEEQDGVFVMKRYELKTIQGMLKYLDFALRDDQDDEGD